MTPFERVEALGSAPPLVRDVGVLALMPEAWGDVWMPRHHVMSRLARYYNVLWMEPAREWRKSWRPKKYPAPALNPALPTLPGFRLEPPSRLYPMFYRPRPLDRFLRKARVRAGVRRLRSMGARRIVLYVWRPDFAYALEATPHALSCYHVDDEYSFSKRERDVPDREARLLKAADRVFLHSPGLWAKKARLSSRPFRIPNGVDYEAYTNPLPEPEQLRAIPHPRVGYIGVVKHFLDIPLFHEVASRNRDMSFVLVGPVRPLGADAEPFDRLAALPNVHMVGPKSVSELPAWAQHLDVGIMPYDLDGYTKFIYPMKLHEYLAAGIPVVGTPIRTLEDFGGTISLALGTDAWCAALRRAVAGESSVDAKVAERRRIARAFDWNRITHRVAGIIAEGLGPDVEGAVASASFFEDDPELDATSKAFNPELLPLD